MSIPPRPPTGPSPDVVPLVDGPRTASPAWLGAWGWSASAMVISAVSIVLVSLPFYPRDDHDTWAELGWFILVLGAVVVVGIVAGALAFGIRLERAGDPHPVLTSVLMVPVALALGAVSAGVGALLAPPVAFWLVSGFSQRRAGPAGEGRHHGRAQRALVALLFCGLATAWVISWFGYRL